MKFLILVAILALTAINVESHVVPKLDQAIVDKINPCYVDVRLRDVSRSLPMTLDFLLTLLDKIQRHPNMRMWTAPEMSAALLTRFQMNGIEDTKPVSSGNENYAVTVNPDELSKSNIVRQFMISPKGQYVEGTLLPEEECALHYMLSWSNNNTNPQKNWDYEPVYEYYPRSSGLLYSGVFGNIALGPVFQGIAASSYDIKKTVGDLSDELGGEDLINGQWPTIKNMQLIDFYAATISAELGQTAVWSITINKPYPQPYVGPKGYWNSTYCPSNYTLSEKTIEAVTMAAAPELVGAIDGFVIASLMQTIPPEFKKVTLPQVMRMYYGKGLRQNSYNACERRNHFSSLPDVQVQSEYFGHAYASVSGMTLDTRDLSTVMGNVMDAFRREYVDTNFLDCNTSNSVFFSGKAQKNEIKNDVLFVLDVDNANSEEGFWEQKEFVMNVMREVDAMVNGSHYGLYVNSAGAREIFPLDPTYPSARRRCDILQRIIDPSSTDMQGTIRHVKEVIRGLKQTQRNNRVLMAPGKVVIFIYLESTFKNKEEVEREVQQFKHEHPDVTVLAVGRNAEVLKLLVREPEKDVFFKSGEPIVYHVPHIIGRFATSPVTVEYTDCYNGNTEEERGLVATEFVYSNTNQWFSVPQIYMNSSYSMKLQIRADYGTVKVCTTRKRPEMEPTFESDYCHDVTSSGSSSGEPLLTLGPMQPCYDYPNGGCPDYYFYVQGKTKSANEICSNVTCESLHQVQLTITHQDMRCAGSFSGVEISFLVMSVVVSVVTLWA